MKLKDFKDGELEKKLEDKQEKLRQFRFGVSGSKTKNVKEGSLLRKEIAQIMTEKRRRIKN
ncbi:50S ribosomal protein L29 [Candidatus Nomurabacteria bacterium RIFCSPLOWO2_01_FULL_33_24]|uniref:Large ribosomal subunit protein uL29 n=1 Tax=Candidatus Nomurabacteria bacterium RIFCSPLOWO2_01_FULL_33_24 TaxID=1801765 RepID=A0A1F6X200_9BACT|nr:MAG: 50S ribosomal protein L29 [Candidatus Nomurabacteria bacterium RIFCSPLOWO2_01_FULL_33_24]